MKPGSLPWLLKHELLLSWRSLGKLSRVLTVVLVGVGLLYVIGMSALGVQFASDWRNFISGDEIPADVREVIAAILLWSAFAVLALMWTLSLFQAMKLSIENLFERGDLDLLLSSPLNGEVIFSSRLIAIALSIFASWLPLALPALSIGILIGFPQILGLVPTLLCLALMSASVGILLTLGLVRLLGLKRARVGGQIIASLIGASFFLVSQSIYWFDDGWLGNSVNPETLDPVAEDASQQFLALFAAGGLLSADNPLLLVPRALVADGPSLILFVGASAVTMWFTVKIAYRSFLRSTQQATNSARRKRRGRIPIMRFQSGYFRILLLKEWRSIWRNPFLVSRTLLQILYLIPAMVLIVGRSSDVDVGLNTSAQVGLISVFLGSSLVAALTSICVDGEEAPDLLASAPISGDRLRVVKLVAAIAPVWLLLAPMYGWLMVNRAERWEWMAIAFIGATVSAAVIRLWSAVPRPRGDLMRRTTEGGGDWWMGLLAFVNAFAWPAATFGWSINQFWGWPGVAMSALAVLAAYARSKTVGSKLGY
ncbi:MAG: hypothetical protein AAGB13_10220 [Cyanobacteria bacterium P01_F01_bin.33]